MAIAPLFLALSSSLLLSTFVQAGVQEVWWDVTYVDGVNPDGLADRRAIGVNGTWPPTPLDVNTTDSLILHVHNSLDAATSIHHHGMFFNQSSWMDGAQAVSECGIPPGGTFDYIVPINSSGQWGTYWAHAHASGQYVDGLRTPLLLHPTEEPYGNRYDEEFTVVLSDWYHDEHSGLLDEFINIANPGGAEPVPDSGLIYYAQNTSYLPPTPTAAEAAVGFNENSTLNFVPGRTYRLRIINQGAFAMFWFWIDGHDMRVIEVDGTDIEETPIDLISVAVAQRYSILVTARNDTNANWAIHANMDVDMFDTIPPELQPNVTSSITYAPENTLTDNGPIDEYVVVADLDMVPLTAIQAPSPTREITLNFVFDTMHDGTNHAMFNDITYNPPLVPAILSQMTLGNNASVQSAYGPSSWVLEQGDVVDITIQNADAGKHPFHLHGHKPMLVQRSTDYTADNDTANPPVPDIVANPMRRDTFHIDAGGSATLRVVADNPGAWILHCHVEWHLEVGLAIQLIEAPLIAQSYAQQNLPRKLIENCQALGAPVEGNAAGHLSTTDLDGWKLGPKKQNNGWHAKGIWALTGCIITALLGMISVVWYSLIGGQISEEEMEDEVKKAFEKKQASGGKLGMIKGLVGKGGRKDVNV